MGRGWGTGDSLLRASIVDLSPRSNLVCVWATTSSSTMRTLAIRLRYNSSSQQNTSTNGIGSKHLWHVSSLQFEIVYACRLDKLLLEWNKTNNTNIGWTQGLISNDFLNEKCEVTGKTLHRWLSTHYIQNYPPIACSAVEPVLLLVILFREPVEFVLDVLLTDRKTSIMLCFTISQWQIELNSEGIITVSLTYKSVYRSV